MNLYARTVWQIVAFKAWAWRTIQRWKTLSLPVARPCGQPVSRLSPGGREFNVTETKTNNKQRG